MHVDFESFAYSQYSPVLFVEMEDKYFLYVIRKMPIMILV